MTKAIKRGITPPAIGDLEDGQLGYDKVGKTLYIGNDIDGGSNDVIGGKNLVKEINTSVEDLNTKLEDIENSISELKELGKTKNKEINDKIDNIIEVATTKYNEAKAKIEDFADKVVKYEDIKTLNPNEGTTKMVVTSLEVVPLQSGSPSLNPDEIKLSLFTSHFSATGAKQNDISIKAGEGITFSTETSAGNNPDIFINVDEELIERIDTLESRVDDIDDKIEEFENKFEELEDKIKELEDTVEEIETLLADTEGLRALLDEAREFRNLPVSDKEGKDLIPGTEFITTEEKIKLKAAVDVAKTALTPPIKIANVENAKTTLSNTISTTTIKKAPKHDGGAAQILINEALALLSTTKSSDDGTDILKDEYWVPNFVTIAGKPINVYKALEIATQYVEDKLLDLDNITYNRFEMLIKGLETAITEFKKLRKFGSMQFEEVAVITKHIGSLNSLLLGTTITDDPRADGVGLHKKYVLPSDVEALELIFLEAKELLDKDFGTDFAEELKQLKAMLKKLEDAIEEFNTKKIKVIHQKDLDKWALIDSLEAAVLAAEQEYEDALENFNTIAREAYDDARDAAYAKAEDARLEAQAAYNSVKDKLDEVLEEALNGNLPGALAALQAHRAELATAANDLIAKGTEIAKELADELQAARDKYDSAKAELDAAQQKLYNAIDALDKELNK